MSLSTGSAAATRRRLQGHDLHTLLYSYTDACLEELLTARCQLQREHRPQPRREPGALPWPARPSSQRRCSGCWSHRQSPMPGSCRRCRPWCKVRASPSRGPRHCERNEREGRQHELDSAAVRAWERRTEYPTGSPRRSSPRRANWCPRPSPSSERPRRAQWPCRSRTRRGCSRRLRPRSRWR